MGSGPSVMLQYSYCGRALLVKQMNKISKIFFLIFLALTTISVVSGFLFWHGIYVSKNAQAEQIIFEIKKGEDFLSISRNLEKAGLIRHRLFFQTYILTTWGYKNLQAGAYLLSSSMNIVQMAEMIIKGESAKIKITVPEGLTLEEIELLGLDLQISGFNLREAVVSDLKQKYDFLKDAPDKAFLEGFLFPDTYYFELGIGREGMIETFLSNFDKKLTPELRQEIENQDKTIFEIITMASILEKEVITLTDKEIVAGILWKRLRNNMPLQVDATVAYVVGANKLSKDDMKIDSPYNTYKYQGLPVGPICNPGIESIRAAVYPKNTSYWYYLSAPSGQSIFSSTLDQHIGAINRYLK